jgi:hypothetical protein
MNLILLLFVVLMDVALSYSNRTGIKTALTDSQVLGTVQSLARIRSILLHSTLCGTVSAYRLYVIPKGTLCRDRDKGKD